MSKEKSILEEFGLIPPTFAKPDEVEDEVSGFQLPKVSDNPNFWNIIIGYLVKEFSQNIIKEGYLDLDQAFINCKNPKVITIREQLEKAKIDTKNIFMGLKGWIGQIVYWKKDIRFRTNKDFNNNPYNEGIESCKLPIMFYQYDRFLPEEIGPSDEEKKNNTPRSKERQEKIDAYFKKNPYTTTDVKIFCSSKVFDEIKQIVDEYISTLDKEKQASETLYIPINDLFVFWVGSSPSRFIKEKEVDGKKVSIANFKMNMNLAYIFKK